MKFSYFFKASWLIQLMVGISLFSVSFLIEKQVLQSFIAAPLLALLLAASLELGKAVAIIWHRYMSYRKSFGYPGSVRLASGTFRLGLLLLSMLCSMLFLSGNLDRPNLEKVKTAEINHSEERLEITLQRLKQQKKERLSFLQKTQIVEYNKARLGFESRIIDLTDKLNKEMNNVINGVFKGPRYEELTARLEREKTRQTSVLEAIRKENKKAYSQLSERLSTALEDKQKLAYDKADNTRLSVIKDDYSEDDRASDPRIVSFLKVYQSVFNAEIMPLQFVFFFSMLISLLMEIGILLAFDTVTLSVLPALKASHEADISKDILHTEIEKEAREDEIRHEEALNRIRNTADNVMGKAREYMSAGS